MMVLLLEELRSSGCRRVFVSHRPYNPTAESLFASLGFEEYDLEPDGEVVRLLDWRKGPLAAPATASPRPPP
jgi:hypothetical protein